MKNVLIIYTGGTIGMMQEHESRTLIPVNFKSITDQIPELKHLNCKIDFHASNKPIDSSNVEPSLWEELGSIIGKNYKWYDGFVILHGTDTMAYTASALSFMLKNLAKPVILTGSQLPLGVIRTDAKRNLITAIEIAVADVIVPEVCIYFNSQLFRGNRAEKYSSSKFDAFQSLNYPVLAEAGTTMEYNTLAIRKKPSGKFSVDGGFIQNVALIKIFPGIRPEIISTTGGIAGLKAIIIETFGSGNAPTTKEFITALRLCIRKGIIVLNISQCSGGSVLQGKYETSLHLKQLGVVSGGDMTTESAVVKTMWLLDKKYPKQKTINQLLSDISGERTV
jgi:L-asparaginase